MDSGHWQITITGEVDAPRTFDVDQLAALADDDVAIDFHCHEGWSRLDQRYHGVALATLLRLASTRLTARYVTVASGDYTVVLTREQVEDDRVLLALQRDDRPLARPRLVGPSEWDCFLSVKDVDRIQATPAPQPATAPSIALARIGR